MVVLNLNVEGSVKLLKAGVELAREKGFKRLEANTLATNKAMRRTAEKAGFQLEGMRRRWAQIVVGAGSLVIREKSAKRTEISEDQTVL